jgi:hypothetical protein
LDGHAAELLSWGTFSFSQKYRFCLKSTQSA